MKSKFILIISLLLSFTTTAQKWTNYNRANTCTQLCSNVVNAIAIDTLGNVWFGTGFGVSKFDGTNWTNYATTNGLASNYINTIVVDTHDNNGLELQMEYLNLMA